MLKKRRVSATANDEENPGGGDTAASTEVTPEELQRGSVWDVLALAESVLEQQAPDDLPPGTPSADEDTEHYKFSSSPWDDDANETGPLARAAAGQGSGSAALHLSPLARAAALPLPAVLPIQENMDLDIYSVGNEIEILRPG